MCARNSILLIFAPSSQIFFKKQKKSICYLYYSQDSITITVKLSKQLILYDISYLFSLYSAYIIKLAQKLQALVVILVKQYGQLASLLPTFILINCPFPLQIPVATCQNHVISNDRTMYLQDRQFQGSCSSWCRLLRDLFLGPQTALPVETRARFSHCEFCPQTGTNPAKKGQVVSIFSI